MIPVRLWALEIPAEVSSHLQSLQDWHPGLQATHRAQKTQLLTVQKSARLKTRGASFQLSFTVTPSEGSPPSSGSPPPELPPPGSKDESTTNDNDDRPLLQSTHCARHFMSSKHLEKAFLEADLLWNWDSNSRALHLHGPFQGSTRRGPNVFLG